MRMVGAQGSVTAPVPQHGDDDDDDDEDGAENESPLEGVVEDGAAGVPEAGVGAVPALAAEEFDDGFGAGDGGGVGFDAGLDEGGGDADDLTLIVGGGVVDDTGAGGEQHAEMVGVREDALPARGEAEGVLEVFPDQGPKWANRGGHHEAVGEILGAKAVAGFGRGQGQVGVAVHLVKGGEVGFGLDVEVGVDATELVEDEVAHGVGALDGVGVGVEMGEEPGKVVADEGAVVFVGPEFVGPAFGLEGAVFGFTGRPMRRHGLGFPGLVNELGNGHGVFFYQLQERQHDGRHVAGHVVGQRLVQTSKGFADAGGAVLGVAVVAMFHEPGHHAPGRGAAPVQ